MATKKPIPKKSTSTALTIWEQEMAEAAVAQGSTEVHQGGFKAISLRGGMLAIDDQVVEGNEMRVIILSGIHENQLYAGAYDPDEKSTPICYAFGKFEDDMVPHEAAPEPQHQNCEECEHNQWGSADKGKGKTCKNVRRLVCITEDALESAAALEDAEARVLKLPVMSVKNWTAYVKNVLAEEIKRPSWGVVTSIKLVPDPKSQFRVQFKFEELVNFDEALYTVMKKRAALAEETSMTAYPVYEPEEKPAKPARKTIPIKRAAAASPVAAKGAVKGRGKY
jgi:hypothetical protein